MPPPQNKVSILLNGGVDEQASPELGGPIAQQGASAVLRSSLNTRLSTLRGTCTRAPMVYNRGDLAGSSHGVVSCAAGRNSVAFTRAGVATSKVLSTDASPSGAGAGSLLSTLDPTTAQNAYIPGQITRAGAIPSVSALSPPAVCYDPINEWYWTTYYGKPDDASGDARVFITVTDADGAVVVPATLVGTFSGINNGWLAITCHGASGIRLWYQTGNSIAWGEVVRSGNTVSLPFSFNIAVAPSTNDTAACVVSGMLLDADGAVDSTHEAYAYIASSQPSFPDNGRVTRVNINTNATNAINFVGALDGDGAASVTFVKVGSTYHVGVGFHAYTGDVTKAAVLHVTTLVSTASADDGGTGSDRDADIAVQFLSTPVSGSALMVVKSLFDGSLSATTLSVNGCNIYSLPLATSTLTPRGVLPWCVLRSHGAALRFSATELYPIFDIVPNFGTDAETPLDPDYVLDPSVVMYLFGSLTHFTPVARYGCVRFNLAPALIAPAEALPCGTAAVGTKVYATYLKDIVGSSAQDDYPARFVEVDFAPFQPPVAHDKDGVAMIAAALPVQWDGSEVMELGGPLCAPHFRIDETGGTGPVFPAGDYTFGAVYTCTDAGGLEHRSTPTTLLHTSVGGSPVLYASTAMSMRQGVTQAPMDLTLYCSETDGPTQHLLPDRPYAYVGVLNTLQSISLANVSRKHLYTRGAVHEEQPAQPPPPAQDICIIGDRCWILDAEVRSRIVHSKQRISGKGFEFHAVYEVLLPSGAGRTVAIREWQGNVVVFTEYAIYGISGDGPDNLVGNPSGGSFSAPQLLATVGCSSRESVISTPKGILFQRGNDILAFAGGEPTAVMGVQPSAQATGVVLLRDYDEVSFLVDGQWKVYNYAVSRWSLWDAPTDASFVHVLAYDPSNAIVVTSDETPTIYRLDADAESTTAHMSWTTDWMVLGGDFQDSVLIQQIVLSARRAGAHGCTIDVYTNYDESTPTTTVEWLPGVLTTPRYDLFVQPRNSPTRAVKIKITETQLGEGSSGMRPICLTLLWALEGALQERARIPGTYK